MVAPCCHQHRATDGAQCHAGPGRVEAGSASHLQEHQGKGWKCCARGGQRAHGHGHTEPPPKPPNPPARGRILQTPPGHVPAWGRGPKRGPPPAHQGGAGDPCQPRGDPGQAPRHPPRLAPVVPSPTPAVPARLPRGCPVPEPGSAALSVLSRPVPSRARRCRAGSSPGRCAAGRAFPCRAGPCRAGAEQSGAGPGRVLPPHRAGLPRGPLGTGASRGGARNAPTAAEPRSPLPASRSSEPPCALSTEPPAPGMGCAQGGLRCCWAPWRKGLVFFLLPQ